MAKIDTSQIAGYAEMTPEEKLAALEGFELPEPDLTGYVKKDKLDKAAHDAAEWKKKYNAQLSDDEQARQALIEKNETMEAELTTLRREKSISSYTAKFATQGYDEKLAKSTAEALADGDMETVFANQEKFLETVRAEAEANKVKNTGKPGSAGGGVPEVVTKDAFMKMSYDEQLKFKAEHPNWQSELK